jgi:hypothetical protein
MLILDKQKAVERVVALIAGESEAASEGIPPQTHARTYQRIATFERRPYVPPAPMIRRGVERRRRRMRLVVNVSPT